MRVSETVRTICMNEDRHEAYCTEAGQEHGVRWGVEPEFKRNMLQNVELDKAGRDNPGGTGDPYFKR